MKLTSLTPMLATTDLAGTIKFYTEILGFTCENIMPEAGWAHLKQDDVSIMFTAPNAHEPFDKAQLTGSLYIRTEEVDSMWGSVKDKTQVCYPIENFDYGMREFAIYDNNHYLLQFGQPIIPE